MRIVEIQIGKKKWELAAGLIWHPLQSSGSARAKEIISYAHASDANLKVLRGDHSPHVGLAKRLEGGKAGQLSAAALVADDMATEGHRNTLAAVSLPDNPDQFLFVAVRGGVILADGDVVGTREEIRSRLVGDVAYGGWDAVICPSEWGVLDAVERSFDSFFERDALKIANQWKLKDTTIAWRKAIAPLALLLIVALGSTYGWHTWQKRRAMKAEALRLQQEMASREQIKALVQPPKPWTLLPYAPVFAQACTQAFAKVGTSAGNWKLDGVVCEGGALTVKWIKPNESAWISHLKAIRPDAIIASDGLSATVTVPASAVASNDSTTTLPRANGLNLRYYDLASRYGMAIRIDPSPKMPATPATLPEQVAAPALPDSHRWRELPIQVLANFDPVEVASVVDFPGLRFTKLAYAFKDGAIQYQLSGIQYVQP